METLPAASMPTTPSSRTLAIAALVAVALGWAYAPNLDYLQSIWSSDPNFSHGYFVLPIALFILWVRRDTLPVDDLRPRWWGLALLAVPARPPGLALPGESALARRCDAPARGGLPGPDVRRLAPPAMEPAGDHHARLHAPAAGPDQHGPGVSAPAHGDARELPAPPGAGPPVLAEGNRIIVGQEELEVARACNGLSMLLSFLTLITAAAILVDRPILDRFVLLASAIPIALVSNILRISITAWCFHRFGTDELLMPGGYRLPHDWAGYLMMPIALIIVFGIELPLLSWLLVEAPDDGESYSPIPGLVPSTQGRQQAPLTS
jgi:exosortase/archaeosortase family protein